MDVRRVSGSGGKGRKEVKRGGGVRRRRTGDRDERQKKEEDGGGGRGMCPKRRMHAETRKRYIRGLAAGDGRPGPSFFHLYVRYSHAQT